MSDTDSDLVRELDDVGRKVVRIGSKLYSVVEKIPKVAKKFIKGISWSGSVKRYNKCRGKGNAILLCTIAEGANRMTRMGIQAAGVTYITAGTTIMSVPTGISQILGSCAIIGGVKIIYDADDVGNFVSKTIQDNFGVKAEKVKVVKKFERCNAPLDGPINPKATVQPKDIQIELLIPEDLFYQIPREMSIPEQDVVRYLINKCDYTSKAITRRNNHVQKYSNDITTLSNDVALMINSFEVVPDRTDNKTNIFARYHENFFDAKFNKGYMDGVSQPTTSQSPTIVFMDRLPDIKITKKEQSFMIPLGTINF